MSRSSRARREARRRQTRRPAPGPRSSGGDRAVTRGEVLALVDLAIRYASVSERAAAPRVAELNQLGATTPAHDPAVVVVDEVLARLGVAWEHGWQPLDLVHAARRRTSAAVARWIGRAVLAEADHTGALERAPQAWVDQLAALRARDAHDDGQAGLLVGGGHASVPEWTVALVATAFLRQLPASQRLMDPPSRWGRAAPAATGPRLTGADDKTLTRVRALLAKAESTEFAAEAEAFTAKAQDLMTRHAIDEALLADEAGRSVEVRALRVLIHQPYAVQKAALLDVVGRANRTQAIWNDFASCMTIVGVPTDLDQVEMLFTSLLVQATRAMTQAASVPGAGDAHRSSGFRKAFLAAYATRIGDRLAISADDAAATYGTALVPVLQRQSEAVRSEFDRLFPHVTRGSRRATYDARGWDAGTEAADAAVLPAGSLES